MFGRKPKVTSIKLEEAMLRLLDDMEMFGPNSEEYPLMLGHYQKLHTMSKSEDSRRVTPDTVALVAGNLLGILIIVAYEQKHVMTSKGLGFVLKSK